MNSSKLLSSWQIHETSLPFKQMENISQYLTVCERLGMNKVDLFQTIDLYEGKDMMCVLNSINALKQLAEQNSNNLKPLLQEAKKVSVISPVRLFYLLVICNCSLIVLACCFLSCLVWNYYN